MSPLLFDKILWPFKLSDPLLGKLLDVATYKKGVSSLGIKNSYIEKPVLIYVLNGTASIHFLTHDDTVSSGTIVGSGDWLGAMSIQSNCKTFYHIEEIEELHMLCFPESKLVDISHNHPEIYKLLYSVGQDHHQTILQSMLSSIHNKFQKVIYYLLELELRQNHFENNEIVVKISQTQLSAISGISRCRLNEILKLLESQCLIVVKRGRIVLVDKGKLQDTLQGMNLMYRNQVMNQPL